MLVDEANFYKDGLEEVLLSYLQLFYFLQFRN